MGLAKERIGELTGAFEQGLKDGYEQARVNPDGKLSSGMTWDDPERNEAYDSGAAVGERLAEKED